jgi:preprotein translocase subunit SecD
MFGRRSVCVLLLTVSAAIVACDRLPFAVADQPGGAYLVLEVDAAVLQRQELERVADQMAEELRNAVPAIRYSGRGVLNDAARIRLHDPADRVRALEALHGIERSENGVEVLALSEGEDGYLEARLAQPFLNNQRLRAANRSIEVIRRRLDPTGMMGLEIMRRDNHQIFVRAPRINDPTQIRRSVGVVGHLTFHLVREVSPDDAAAGRLPPGTMLAQPYPGIGQYAEVVERRPRLSGENLEHANPSADQYTQEFVLAFELDREGARIFCRITRDHTGQRFAILLDNQVLTAPTVNEPICGGTGQISGNFTPQSAAELASILNSGALPTPLTVIEEGVLPRE